MYFYKIVQMLSHPSDFLNVHQSITGFSLRKKNKSVPFLLFGGRMRGYKEGDSEPCPFLIVSYCQPTSMLLRVGLLSSALLRTRYSVKFSCSVENQ